MGPRFRVVSRIFEPGEDFPIVVHVFNGRTLDQARRFYVAHMKSDAFLRDCVAQRHYGQVRCREEHIEMELRSGSWRVV